MIFVNPHMMHIMHVTPVANARNAHRYFSESEKLKKTMGAGSRRSLKGAGSLNRLVRD